MTKARLKYLYSELQKHHDLFKNLLNENTNLAEDYKSKINFIDADILRLENIYRNTRLITSLKKEISQLKKYFTSKLESFNNIDTEYFIMTDENYDEIICKIEKLGLVQSANNQISSSLSPELANIFFNDIVNDNQKIEREINETLQQYQKKLDNVKKDLRHLTHSLNDIGKNIEKLDSFTNITKAIVTSNTVVTLKSLLSFNNIKISDILASEVIKFLKKNQDLITKECLEITVGAKYSSYGSEITDYIINKNKSLIDEKIFEIALNNQYPNIVNMVKKIEQLDMRWFDIAVSSKLNYYYTYTIKEIFREFFIKNPDLISNESLNKSLQSNYKSWLPIMMVELKTNLVIEQTNKPELFLQAIKNNNQILIQKLWDADLVTQQTFEASLRVPDIAIKMLQDNPNLINAKNLKIALQSASTKEASIATYIINNNKNLINEQTFLTAVGNCKYTSDIAIRMLTKIPELANLDSLKKALKYNSVEGALIASHILDKDENLINEQTFLTAVGNCKYTSDIAIRMLTKIPELANLDSLKKTFNSNSHSGMLIAFHIIDNNENLITNEYFFNAVNDSFWSAVSYHYCGDSHATAYPRELVSMIYTRPELIIHPLNTIHGKDNKAMPIMHCFQNNNYFFEDTLTEKLNKFNYSEYISTPYYQNTFFKKDDYACMLLDSLCALGRRHLWKIDSWTTTRCDKKVFLKMLKINYGSNVVQFIIDSKFITSKIVITTLNNKHIKDTAYEMLKLKPNLLQEEELLELAKQKLSSQQIQDLVNDNIINNDPNNNIINIPEMDLYSYYFKNQVKNDNNIEEQLAGDIIVHND